MSQLAKMVNEESLQEFRKQDEFLAFINNSPPPQFVKDHPLAAGVKYLPIDKVELMLDKIFQIWRVEVLDSGQLLNSLYVTVRLHYKHPITGDMEFQDGIGAMAIQVDKGKNASELQWIKSDAIMKGLPAAKSYAIKDAAEHIGKLFGRDLNRKDTMAFTASYGVDDHQKKIEEAKTGDELRKIYAAMNPAEKKEYADLMDERRRELKNGDTSTS